MKRKLLTTLAVLAILFFSNVVVEAATITMNSGVLTDYNTRYDFESIGNVTITGYDWGISTDKKAIWLFENNVAASTNNYLSVIAGQDVYIQFLYSDDNDGMAKIETKLVGTSIWVDEGTLPTHNGGNQYALLTGLSAGNYFLRITSLDQQNNGEWDDLHLDYYGTTTTPVPEPTTMLLFGTGIAGLVGFVKRKK